MPIPTGTKVDPWQAYSQVGSSETGWLDILAGRQALRFGDERGHRPIRMA